MKYLSRILFYFSSLSILPPDRETQNLIISKIQKTHLKSNIFLRQSLRQYDCNSFYFNRLVWICFNFFSFIFIGPLFLFLVIRSLKKSDISFESDISLYHRIPLQIKTKFAPIFIKKPIGYLRFRDMKYAFRIIFKSGFRPYFWLRGIWKIAIYSEIIDLHRPSRLWVTQEMVFESSLLTNYLADFKIEHINFMHGDNYFSIQVAFCSFSQFYVWDSFYIDLFLSLSAEVKEFHLFSSLDRVTSSFQVKNLVKYYNQESQNLEKFEFILNNLVTFSIKKNCELVVRLHPLHKKKYEIDILNHRKIKIESNDIDPIDSIYESKFVCSEFSSILYQASLLNRKIVVDNSFPDRINLIKGFDPIFLKKLEHEFLVTSSETFHKSNGVTR